MERAAARNAIQENIQANLLPLIVSCVLLANTRMPQPLPRSQHARTVPRVRIRQQEHRAWASAFASQVPRGAAMHALHALLVHTKASMEALCAWFVHRALTRPQLTQPLARDVWQESILVPHQQTATCVMTVHKIQSQTREAATLQTAVAIQATAERMGCVQFAQPEPSKIVSAQKHAPLVRCQNSLGILVP